MVLALDSFLQQHMRKGGRFVPARLQAALALLERLREDASLDLHDHLASKGSSGLASHETFGNRAHERWNIQAINKNHGRRSSSLQDWGQALLDSMKTAGWNDATAEGREALAGEAQEAFVSALRAILEQEPLEVRMRGRAAQSVVAEILAQADAKGKAGEVAQYLVGAKLMRRLSKEIPVYPANKADRKSWRDKTPRYGDFEICNTVFEVALGLPDEKHITQVVDALEATDADVWLLTRDERVPTWKIELGKADGVDMRRVSVTSVEYFVGQNLSELGGFSTKGKREQLRQLIALYNGRWIENVGTPGIRIEIK